MSFKTAKKIVSSKYLDAFSNNRFQSLRSRKSLPRYLEWIFDDIDFRDSIVYDIGGGNGLVSFHAAENGAKRVICVEPLQDGSNEQMLLDFADNQTKLVNGERVEFLDDTLQSFVEKIPAKADIIILHNTINHFDEDSCISLTSNNPESRKKYLNIFDDVNSLLKKDGIVLVADASRKSIWNLLNVTNPFAPTIEREVHQQPDIWISMMEDVGFKHRRLRWTPMVAQITGIGALKVFANKFTSVLTLGHFAFTMTK